MCGTTMDIPNETRHTSKVGVYGDDGQEKGR
jgi:hypothetical protein